MRGRMLSFRQGRTSRESNPVYLIEMNFVIWLVPQAFVSGKHQEPKNSGNPNGQPDLFLRVSEAQQPTAVLEYNLGEDVGLSGNEYLVLMVIIYSKLPILQNSI